MQRNTVFLIAVFTIFSQNCSCVYKDVVWLIDVSSAISTADHVLIIDFIYNVTSYLTIGSSDIRMAVTSFDVETNAEVELDDHDVKENLLAAINNIPPKLDPDDRRKTMDALTYTKTSFLTIKGGRNDASKVVIAIVGGVSTDTSATTTVANELRTTYNAELFSIGVGSLLTSTNTELQSIANDPDSYYMEYIGGFINLCGLIPSLVPKIDNETTASLMEGCVVWEDPSEQNMAYSNINEGVSVGAIVGLILTCLLLLALSGLLFYFLWRRKRKKKIQQEADREDKIIKAVNDYNDSSLGEKNYTYKRDYTNSSLQTTKAIYSDTPLSSVYENLGEKSVTSSFIDVRVPF